MKVLLLKIRPWESSHSVRSNFPLSKGDVIIVETTEGTESAIVEDVFDAEKEIAASAESVKILRKANLRDLRLLEEHCKKEKNAIELCRKEARKYNLLMKIVGCKYSVEGGSITFAFIADGRVDFRSLVKDLSKIFQRSIRLHQIGARDEAREKGGVGICGRELCCIKFKGNLPSISSDMAKIQQIIRRGSQRISGSCGRLMCCLAFEAEFYQKIFEKMPPLGSEISIKGAKGILKDVNALSGKVEVELSDKSILRANLEDFIDK